jgi:hypothetical protein
MDWMSYPQMKQVYLVVLPSLSPPLFDVKLPLAKIFLAQLPRHGELGRSKTRAVQPKE